jgi:hypothetical protein
VKYPNIGEIGEKEWVNGETRCAWMKSRTKEEPCPPPVFILGGARFRQEQALFKNTHISICFSKQSPCFQHFTSYQKRAINSIALKLVEFKKTGEHW